MIKTYEQYSTANISPLVLSKQIKSTVLASIYEGFNLGSSLVIEFSEELTTQQEDILDAVLLSHNPNYVETVSVPTIKVDGPKNSRGIPKAAYVEAEGDAATIVSHDFSKPTSWYQGSVEVIKGELTLVSGNTFKYSDKVNWIKLRDGNIYDEDNINLKTNNKYIPKIYVNDVLQSPEDYLIDFDIGTVTFDEEITQPVTASFYYADKSWFIIKPTSGNLLGIKNAEIQFSVDVILEGKVMVFEPWFLHPITQVMTPIPSKAIYYKSASDFMSTSNEGYILPAWGGLTKETINLPYKYARLKPLLSSQGTEIRVYIKDHQPIIAEMATATFWVVVDSET